MMKKRNRCIWATIFTFVFFGVMLGGFFVCEAEQPKVLKFAHQWTQGDIRDRWASNFSSSVEKYTKGSLKCQVYPGGTLMDPRNQIDALRRGALDLCIWHFAYSAGKEPLLGILDLGGVVPYPEKGLRIAQTEVGKKMSESAEKLGMKPLAWGFMPTSVGSTKTLIKLPKDMVGQKMRGGSKAIEELFQAAGAAITHVSTGDVYMALQTGVLDSVLTADASFLSFRLYDVLKFLTISGQHSFSNASIGIVISPVSFAKLTPDEQKSVLQAGKESEASFLADVKADSSECGKVYAEKGIKVAELTDQEHQTWTNLAKEKTWKPFMEQVKGSAELFAIIEKTK
jgi:TRAP-type transport system periplasmic protein